MKYQIYERPAEIVPQRYNDLVRWTWMTCGIEMRYRLGGLRGESAEQEEHARFCRAACFIHLELSYHMLKDYDEKMIEWAEAALDKIIDHARTEMDAQTWIERGERYIFTTKPQSFFIENLLTNYKRFGISRTWPK